MYGKGREGKAKARNQSALLLRKGGAEEAKGEIQWSEKYQREPIKGTEQGNRFVFAFGFRLSGKNLLGLKTSRFLLLWLVTYTLNVSIHTVHYCEAF